MTMMVFVYPILTWLAQIFTILFLCFLLSFDWEDMSNTQDSFFTAF